MFEHNLFQIFGPRNGKLLCPLFVLQNGIFNAICDLVLLLFREGIDISVRLDGAIPFQHFNMVVEVHSGSYIALRSTKASLYDHEEGTPSKSVCTCFEKFTI